jgi:hypothetical protein
MGSKSAIGIGNGICFKQVRDKGGGSYIDPLVRDSIVGLWKFDQNTNESPTSNIIKNAIKDKGGDLELLNFGYKLNSGYGGYIEDFSLFILSNRFEYSKISDTKITITAVLDNSAGIYHSVTEEDSALYWNTFKIKVSGSTDDVYISYTTAKKNIRLYNGINTVVVPNELSWHSFSASKANTSCNITLEFVPLYEGALVTDGKDDMIVSQKSFIDIVGSNNQPYTIVSMISFIDNLHTYFNSAVGISYMTINNIANSAKGKTGIFGYSATNINNTPTSIINNILGDKNDYSTRSETADNLVGRKFSIQGYLKDGIPINVSSVAVYWTFIANKVLTTDEINQIIAYYELDKYVTPQVIYDVKRQGLTNDTPEADWYLKDFSGNGHDMQLYNFAKKLGSGIGKYEVDFNTWIPQSYVDDSAYTSNKLHITNIKDGNAILYTKKEANAMKVKITGIRSLNLVYRYITGDDTWGTFKFDGDGIYELPAGGTTTKTYYTGFSVLNYIGDCDITIEQIPDYEGALVSDGKDNYGKAEGLPILKDYTVASKYSRFESTPSYLLSKAAQEDDGAFIFNDMSSSYSFGTSSEIDTHTLFSTVLRYQSKYINQGKSINAGSGIDTDSLWLSIIRDNDTRLFAGAFYSMLLFPYSLSEFLLERQLKKYKLGTLYPDMVEFRPIIKNNKYRRLDFYTQSWDKIIYPGDYVPINSILRANIYFNNEINELQSFRINGINVTFVKSSVDKTAYNIGNIPITKSPQKIDMIINEYIRYEDIVQPYPAIINLKQDGKTITWGDKLKIGSDIVFVGSANLLPELYTVSKTRYNGVTLYPNTIIKVEKSMVFDNARTYLKANEPSCILSPNRLRIPNSSYKILGYIPDLTGKRNHGKLNNFAYAGMSGVNGYVEPFNDNKWHISSSANKINRTDNKITVVSLKANRGIIYVDTETYVNEIKVIATGIPVGGELIFHQDTDITIPNNVIVTIGGKVSTGSWEFIVNDLTLDWSNLVIEQLGQYEGSFCLDAVDDYITIPTLAHGGKQVLMKVNLQSYNRYLYDQRNIWSQYLAIVSSNKTIAYEYSNKDGKTYIDGILNEHIIDKDLLNITHNIIATNANIEAQYAPNIGTSFARSNFAQMALFDFMLFPDISSEEEIKELNEVISIEGGYVESPDYYWDAYGKKNTDTDRNLIADQVSKDVANALEVNNVDYNSKSGYTDDNGLLLDGVDDHAVNTVIPAVTDFTVIAKRISQASTNDTMFITKGQDGVVANSALGLEYRNINGEYVYSFGTSTNVESIPDLITYCTPTNYNGKVLTRGKVQDTNGIQIGKFDIKYWKGVFYKLMFYTKTIDQLSINMLKNLFERDELIDVTNPIFKKKEL